MHLGIIDWIIIVVYLLLSLGIGLYFKANAGKSLNDFFLGGRNLNWFVAGVSMVATTFAADTPLAVTELVAQKGIAGNWLWWSFLAGGMFTVFFFSRLWRRAEVLTEAELIELRYSGKPAALLRGFKAVYLGLFMNCIIIGWVNVAMMSILKIFFDLDYNETLILVAMLMMLTAAYSAMSGLMGVAVTDMVQFFIAMAGCIILAILVVNSDEIGGIDKLKSNLSPETLNFFPKFGGSHSASAATGFTITALSFFTYIGIQWYSSWYPGAEPGGGGYIAQRMMSAKNEKHSLFATLFFTFAHYCLRPWPWIVVGLCSLVLYPELAENDKKLGFVMAMKDFLPSGLRGLLLVAFLAAYMSTISTQLNWGSSYLVNDLYKRFLRKSKENSSHDEEKHLVKISRWVTILSMMIALYVTTLIDSISAVWSFIMECGAGLGIVLILRWFWWRVNAVAEITATIAPFVFFAISSAFEIDFPHSYIFTVLFTTVSWIVAMYLSMPTDMEKLRKFYEKVKPAGNWKVITNENKSSELKIQFLLWILAIIAAYTLLFAIGYSILHFYSYALICYAIMALSLLLMINLVKKSGIFN